MEVSKTAVGFAFEEDEQKLIDKKLERIKYAEEHIVDIALRVKEDGARFIFDCTINFRWGATAHITTEEYKFSAGLDKLMDVLDQKIKKEKDKIQEKGK
jgi:putative sigma-54 modulation protein